MQIQVAYNTAIDNLANINGYQNLILASQLTNPFFQENPNEALDGNSSVSKNSNLRLSVSAKKSLGDDLKLIGSQSFTFTNSTEDYQLSLGTFEYEDGYTSLKENEQLQSNTFLKLITDFEILDGVGVNTVSKFQLQHTELDYNFGENQIANPLTARQSMRQDILEMQHNITLDYYNNVFVNLSATSIASSRQEGALFVPQNLDFGGAFLRNLGAAETERFSEK